MNNMDELLKNHQKICRQYAKEYRKIFGEFCNNGDVFRVPSFTKLERIRKKQEASLMQIIEERRKNTEEEVAFLCEK